jgi:hypothetical protein
MFWIKGQEKFIPVERNNIKRNLPFIAWLLSTIKKTN